MISRIKLDQGISMKRLALTILLLSNFASQAAQVENFLWNCSIASASKFIELEDGSVIDNYFQLFVYRSQAQDNLTFLYFHGESEESTSRRYLTAKFHPTVSPYVDQYTREVEPEVTPSAQWQSDYLQIAWEGVTQISAFNQVAVEIKRDSNFKCGDNGVRRKTTGTLSLNHELKIISCVQSGSFNDALEVFQCE